MTARLAVIAGPESGLAAEIAALAHRTGARVESISGLDESNLARAGAADLAVIDADSPGFADYLEPLIAAVRRPPLVIAEAGVDFEEIAGLYRRGVGFCVVRPYHGRELGSVIAACLADQRRLVALGGGTGLYTLLTALRSIPELHPTAVVTTSDDGGSSGVLRDELGVLPPGDIRRSLLALSNTPDLIRQLMSFRFSRGRGLEGHNLGNLLLAGLSEITGSAFEGFRAMGELLDISGVVLPVASELDELVAEFEDGSVVRGEHRIDVPDGRSSKLRIRRLTHEPLVPACLDALTAICGADLVTIGPGDLYTSVLASLTVDGVARALAETRARVVYFCNLMTKPGETHGYTAADHLRALVDHIGAGLIDEVVVSRTELPTSLLARYRLEDQEPVAVDLDRLREVAPEIDVWEADVGSSSVLARHNVDKLASLLADMCVSDLADQ